MTTRIFIDTEFTNFIDMSRISLAMVAETGEEEYIEVDFDAKECSDFVREASLPQLGRDPNAYCARPDLRGRILNWLSLVRHAGPGVEIAFDYATDWNLFVDALDDNVPGWCTGVNVAYRLNNLFCSMSISI